MLLQIRIMLSPILSNEVGDSDKKRDMRYESEASGEILGRYILQLPILQTGLLPGGERSV